MSGEMENPESSANHQLPEVDSLPDGFVESSAEPQLSTFEHQREDNSNPCLDYKQGTISPPDDLPDSNDKPRTFPVPLSDKDTSTESSNVTSHDQSNPEPTLETQHQHLQEACLSNKKSTGGVPEPEATDLMEKSTPECAELLKKKKLETSEVKRKTVKRSFKSEKEFLEFSLKYQQVIAERDSAVAVRAKLESLCRALQHQNKKLMDECERVSKEGENMRLDLSTRFHDAIKDVSQKLEGQTDECLKENDMLRNQVKYLSDQNTIAEQQFTQKLKQKSLELQLADLKIQQHEEKLIQEQSQMKLYAEQVSQLLATEQTLRLQLAADGEKFQQFQEALVKSNEVFETFKLEIEKMAKSIKELKKENAFLKGKCERSDVTLIELVEEREQWKKQLEKVKNQKEKLESLCRSLQAERKQSSGGGGCNKCDSDAVPSKASSSEAD